MPSPPGELTRSIAGGQLTCAGLPRAYSAHDLHVYYTTQPMDVFTSTSRHLPGDRQTAPRYPQYRQYVVVPFVPLPPSASIVASTSTVIENGAQSLSYTVTLSDPAAAPISVHFSLGGSATAGVDYTASANPLVIPAGSSTGTITIDPTGDTNVEPDETVIVSLVTGSGYTLGAPTSATGTLVNDDLPSLSINDVSWQGNAGTVTHLHGDPGGGQRQT